MILSSPPPVLNVDSDPLPVLLEPPRRRGRRREVPPLRRTLDVSVRLVVPPHGDGHEPVPFDDELPLPLIVAAVAVAPARLLGGLGGRAGGRRGGPPGRLRLLGRLDVHGDHIYLVTGRGRRRRGRQEDRRRWPLKDWWRRRRRWRQSEHRWWRRRLDDDWRRRWWGRCGYDRCDLPTECHAALSRWFKVDHLLLVPLLLHRH